MNECDLQVIPKVSASVNASLAKPPHCFEIRPTWLDPSKAKTFKNKKIHILVKHLSTLHIYWISYLVLSLEIWIVPSHNQSHKQVVTFDLKSYQILLKWLFYADELNQKHVSMKLSRLHRRQQKQWVK